MPSRASGAAIAFGVNFNKVESSTGSPNSLYIIFIVIEGACRGFLILDKNRLLLAQSSPSSLVPSSLSILATSEGPMVLLLLYSRPEGHSRRKPWTTLSSQRIGKSGLSTSLVYRQNVSSACQDGLPLSLFLRLRCLPAVCLSFQSTMSVCTGRYPCIQIQI
jgi:hypothetical protein